MTEVTAQPETDGQGAAVGVPETGQHHAHGTNRLHFTTADPASDNDASEGPVREALKKTSIASMPRNDPDTRTSKTVVEHDSTIEPNGRQDRDSTGNQTPSPTSESRGRLSRKRSYEDTREAEEVAGSALAEIHHSKDDVSHSRKRSRDVRAVQLPTTEPPAAPTEQPLLEGESADDVALHNEAPTTEPPAASTEQPLLEGESADDVALHDEAPNEDFEASAQSPRKKRSRDEFDIDAHRGQKIPATDEARAYRRSEDSERGQLPQQDDEDTTTIDDSIHREQDTSSANVAALQRVEPPESDLVPPPPTIGASSPQTASKATEAEPAAAQKPPGGFAASGFAAMSGLSKSPFGALGASSPSVFRPNSTTNSIDTTNKSTPGPKQPQAKKSTFSASASPFLTSVPTSSEKSGFGFGINGAASKPSGFGGSVFGSAFSNSTAPAPKLTSFAAPTGDLAPPKPTEITKPFGAQADDSAEEDGGSDGEANHEEVGNGDIEVDSRFQQREVETGEAGEKSIFQSPRAQLYYYDGGCWHEKGKGSFKLNVAENEKEKKARFIMRAHQTFRVLLNQPVFKKMQVGNSKGQEPQGKTVSFAVIDQGRPTPHLLKLSDENESKTLYREVLRLQRDMETQ
ncbi:MAG: hypothetical protein Q9211_006226, partial [Gyalolechia sp. 1 TL-2023]